MEYLEKGKPFIYIYRSYNNDKFFSDMYSEVKEIRANSFSQVKKLEQIEDKFIVIGLTALSSIQKDYLVKKVSSYEGFEEYDIFIDDAYSIITRNNSKILERGSTNRSLFIILQSIRETSFLKFEESKIDRVFFNKQILIQGPLNEELNLRDYLSSTFIDNNTISEYIYNLNENYFTFIKVSLDKIKEVFSSERPRINTFNELAVQEEFILNSNYTGV